MEERKKDHIELAFRSQTSAKQKDNRFWYEPLLSGHDTHDVPPSHFHGRVLRLPLWVSSMTGGTLLAQRINRNLAQVCNEFGMGMGLGSCRILLHSDTYLPDFDMRPIIGNDLPLYANLGICQVEQLLDKGEVDTIISLVERLQADGLIVHVNPMQEWFQPEGDRIQHPPLQTIEELLKLVTFPVIVKEVGQGMGYQSLEALLKLPLAAVEFGAFGGTNFSQVELLRQNPDTRSWIEPLAMVGHDANEMTDFANQIAASGAPLQCRQLIISGGLQSLLDGYYLISRSTLPAIYGQASAFLRYAREDYDILRRYVQTQADGLKLAYNYLKIK